MDHNRRWLFRRTENMIDPETLIVEAPSFWSAYISLYYKPAWLDLGVVRAEGPINRPLKFECWMWRPSDKPQDSGWESVSIPDQFPSIYEIAEYQNYRRR